MGEGRFLIQKQVQEKTSRKGRGIGHSYGLAIADPAHGALLTGSFRTFRGISRLSDREEAPTICSSVHNSSLAAPGNDE